MAGRHRLGAAQARTEPPPIKYEHEDLARRQINCGWSYARRADTDPGVLALFNEIDEQWQDAKNVAYALANKIMGYGELGKYTGTSRASVKERCDRGRKVLARIEAEAVAAGKVLPMTTLGELREIRAKVHIDAQIPDEAAGPKLRLVYDRLRAVGE